MAKQIIIQIEIKGLENMQADLKRIRSGLRGAMNAAAAEAGTMLVSPNGPMKYPPETKANMGPPFPYYIRGRGTQYKGYNLGNSQKMGTQYYVEKRPYGAVIGNRATYARRVVGDNQQSNFRRIGWKTFKDAVEMKMDEIRRIFEGWINRLIK